MAVAAAKVAVVALDTADVNLTELVSYVLLLNFSLSPAGAASASLSARAKTASFL